MRTGGATGGGIYLPAAPPASAATGAPARRRGYVPPGKWRSAQVGQMPWENCASLCSET